MARDNPYLNRQPIRNDAEFIGREPELQQIFNRIGGNTPQSVSVVGERRIGKSSLQRAVVARKDRYLEPGRSYLFVYLDLSLMPNATVTSFFASVMEEIAVERPAIVAEVGEPDYESFRRLVKALDLERTTLVLLLDEFETITRSELFELEFFSFMRSIPNSFAVSLIVTSRNDLQDVCHSSEVAGSPFFNIFHKLNLEGFCPEEAHELICRPSRDSGFPLEPFAEQILSIGGLFPFYLQIACASFFEARVGPLGDKVDPARALGLFKDEAFDHFTWIWKGLDERERATVVKLARAKQPEPEHADVVRELTRRSYVVKKDGRVSLFSLAFADFVCENGGPDGMEEVASSELDAPGPRVFLSYAREDYVHAKGLYDRLKATGYRPWLDREDILAGESWQGAIERGLAEADFFLALLSAASVSKRGFVQKEFKAALDTWRSMLHSDIYLIPIRIDECDVPDTMSRLQWVDYFRSDGWERLLEGLRIGAERRDEPARAEARPMQALFEQVPEPTAMERLRSRVSEAASAAVGSVKPHLATIAILTVAVANVALGLTAYGGPSAWLGGVLGVDPLRLADVEMRFVLTLVLATGYGAAALWLLSRMRVRGRSRFGGASAAGGIVLVLLMFAVNTHLGLPRDGELVTRHQQRMTDRLPEWALRLLDWQHSGGGILGTLDRQGRAQVWSTAQGITSLVSLVQGSEGLATDYPERVRRMFAFIEPLRLPQPEDGWGYWSEREKASTEVTAWVALAYIHSTRPSSLPIWSDEELPRIVDRVARDLAALRARRLPSGAWSSIRTHEEANARTYPTLVAVWAMLEAKSSPVVAERVGDRYDEALRDGIDWLLKSYNEELGWVPNPSRPRQNEKFLGLTAQVLWVLTRAESVISLREDEILLEAKRAFLSSGHPWDDRAIGQNDRISDLDVHMQPDTLSPGGFTMEPSTFLWFPWSYLATTQLALDASLPEPDRVRARQLSLSLSRRFDEANDGVNGAPLYVAAENLYCLSIAIEAS